MTGTYRVGRQQARNIYRDDEYIGVAMRTEDAVEIVGQLNHGVGILRNVTVVEWSWGADLYWDGWRYAVVFDAEVAWGLADALNRAGGQDG